MKDFTAGDWAQIIMISLLPIVAVITIVIGVVK